MSQPIEPTRTPAPVHQGPSKAGWYRDYSAGRMRWWDGVAWTDSYGGPIPRTNHVLHLILSIVTFGLWIPIWIIVAISNSRTRI